MWRNYLTVGLRALTRTKTYALINVFGLAVGMAACLILLIYVRYETSYDHWMPNQERVYQVQTTAFGTEGEDPQHYQITSFAALEAMRRDFPQIDASVWALPERAAVLRGGMAVLAEGVLLVDGPLFEIVQLPFVRGGRGSALAAPGTVVLTQSEALRWFGTMDPIGRTLTLSVWGKTIDHRVTGVVRDPPPNSHLDFNMVVRIEPASFFADSSDILTNWGWLSGHTYLRLQPGADASAIAAALPGWERRNIPDQNADGLRSNFGDLFDWRLTNVADVHLGEAQMAAMRPGNDQRTITTMAVLAVLILLIACVNFTNLATARATQRAREVALRKVLGARRTQLIFQFLGEAMLLTSVAMLLALALVELTLPAFSAYLDAALRVSYFGERGLLLPIAALMLTVGAIAGLYPAFYLSRYKPAAVLKANRSSAETGGAGRLRHALVVAQFAVSIALMVCTAVVYRQTDFARESNPGYQREGILQIAGMGTGEIAQAREALLNEIRKVEGVIAVGRTSIGVATTNSANTLVQVPGRADAVKIGNYPIDAGFFAAIGVDLVAGRGLTEANALDDATVPYSLTPERERTLVDRGINVVVNVLAARRLGFAEPGAAVGKQIRVDLLGGEAELVPATIVGVVENSRFRSVRDPIEPILFRNSRSEHQYLVIRYDHPDPAVVRQRIEAVWHRLAPQVPFEAAFSEDIVSDLYRSENASAETFAAFSLVAIVIACLGLFGLAAFTAERRTKEIGIRKVFGARSRDIVRLLVWQFSKPVIVANLIAWPVAWWVMRDWLNTFDARIALGPTPFALASLLALAIAIGTIAGHAFKVARANPIHALRYE